MDDFENLAISVAQQKSTFLMCETKRLVIVVFISKKTLEYYLKRQISFNI